MKNVVLVLCMAVLFTSCDYFKSKELQQQNDTLQISVTDKEAQINNLLTAMIEVDDNLQQIKEKENLISLNVTSGEVTGQALEDRINSDINLIYGLMVENKNKIADLEKQLKRSGSNNANLTKIIARLNKQMEEKSQEIIRMQQLLESKDFQIADLNFTIKGLESSLSTMSDNKKAVEKKLDATTNDLYRAFYVIGSRKDLKDLNIITSDGFLSASKVMAGGFAEDSFTPVDTREIESISLFSTKAKVLTSHPEASYKLVKGQGDVLSIQISDKDKFWSVSKYLVVQVN